jgi:SET domain-containing protein
MNSIIIVGESAIEGLGVFATSEFLPGDVVALIDDSYVVDAEHPVPRGEERHCDYLQGGKTVWMQVPERHINHACDPNTSVRTRNGVRNVLARGRIRVGDEITYDYCVNGFGDTVWHCHCGSARCRGVIHSDFFHLPLELQKEYLPLLDEWFCVERAPEIKQLRGVLGVDSGVS